MSAEWSIWWQVVPYDILIPWTWGVWVSREEKEEIPPEERKAIGATRPSGLNIRLQNEVCVTHVIGCDYLRSVRGK